MTLFVFPFTLFTFSFCFFNTKIMSKGKPFFSTYQYFLLFFSIFHA